MKCFFLNKPLMLGISRPTVLFWRQTFLIQELRGAHREHLEAVVTELFLKKTVQKTDLTLVFFIY